MAVSIVATKDGERLNFAPHGIFGKLSYDPPLLYVSVLKDHMTARNINKTGKFSINIASTRLLDKVRYLGSVSGMEKDKSKELEVFYGNHGIPMVCDCPVNIACEVYNTMETNDMYIFIGKMIEGYSDEEYIADSYLLVERIDPLICTEQGELRCMGERV